MLDTRNESKGLVFSLFLRYRACVCVYIYNNIGNSKTRRRACCIYKKVRVKSGRKKLKKGLFGILREKEKGKGMEEGESRVRKALL